MTRHPWWSRKYWHPTERDLLLFVNGEGGTKLARKVRDHLEGCWSCTMKRDRMAEAIAVFMRRREIALDGEELSEAADRRFVSRLQRVAEKTECQSGRARQKAARRKPLGIPLHVALAACLLAMITALVWLRFASVPTVSAQEILSRAERSEASRIGAVKDPVVHQLLEVTRRTEGLPAESAYLEFWRDTKNNRWKQATKDSALPGAFQGKSRSRKSSTSDHPMVAELLDVLKSNGMHQNPFSASGFANWRSKLRSPIERVSETVLANGTKALTIATLPTEPLKKNAIAKAEFVVRREDWHPVEHRLSVSETNGTRSYEIREASFEVVTLRSLPASIFDQPSLPLPLMVQSSSRPLVTENQVLTVLELEIKLFHRLHQAGACLGEEIQVVHGASERLEVRGFVGTFERRQALTRLVGDIPNVSVLIQAGNADNEQPPIRAAVEVPPATDARSHASLDDAGGSRLDDLLSSYFAHSNLPADTRHPKMVEFSNKVVSRAQSAQLHAWALRRLAERFADTALESASWGSVGLLRDMIQEHLRELRSSLGDCEEMLKPVLLSLGSPAPSETPAGDRVVTSPTSWQTRCLRIFRLVDPLINDLLGNSQEATRPPERGLVDLSAFPRITNEVRMAEAQLPGLVFAADVPPAASTKSLH